MTALLTTAVIILIVVIVGFYAGRNAKSRSSIEEWSVGGRNFGGLLVWFLVGADIYTAYTFLGLTGYAYKLGAAAFFAVPYVVLAYPIAYFILPKVWGYAAKYHLTTLADFARERFQSKGLGILVALTGIVFLIPYIDLQLLGITGVAEVAGKGTFANPHAVGIGALIVSFILVALYTYFSGLRAPAWTALIKDALVWIVIIVMIITIPVMLFHGWGNMFHTAVTQYPKMLTLHSGAHDSWWFMTAALISALALFMWPHASTGALSARSAEILKKNAVFLPFYNILLFFITFLGIVAYMKLPHSQTKGYANVILLHLIQYTYHNPFVQGLMFATVALASLVPASIMVLAASNLFATNILKDWLIPNMSSKNQTLVARWFVFVMTALALVFGILFPNQLISLQLEGTSGMVQIIPAIALGIFWRRLSRPAVIIGLVGGILMVFLNHFTFHIHGYDGFWGLLVNLVLVLVLNPLFQKDVERNLETNKMMMES
ncbi:sodium:solute symporter [Alicyclobacillus sp. SO9]|uniref:sodium:solute symporter family protein n=1 Tax=Alicyclobacillus sp. SO9 TaxID=2665646 RepID=UPI0018E844C4|nr:sodium:solute symporter [Alicyclobacillus sp. SO9]QQE78892.1 sodium:solute symporter [Alicyclobacillus sp. SO9]